MQALGCRNAGAYLKAGGCGNSGWHRIMDLPWNRESGTLAIHFARCTMADCTVAASLSNASRFVPPSASRICLTYKASSVANFIQAVSPPIRRRCFFFWPDHHSAARSVASSRNSVSCLEAKCKTRNSKLSWQILGKNNIPKPPKPISSQDFLPVSEENLCISSP